MGTMIFTIAVVVTIILFVILNKKASKGVVKMNANQAEVLLNEKNPLILDVRTEEEFKAGHLKSAKNISLQSLSSKIESITEWKDKEVLVYCHSGGRSLAASSMLKQNGFTKIFNLDGGVIAWQSAGNELVE